MASLSQKEEAVALELIVDPQGEALEYTWDLTARFIQTKNNPQIEIDSSVRFPKKDLDSKTVYSDGVIYINDNGATYQAEMEYSMLLTRIYRVYPEVELSASQLKDLESYADEEGLVLEFTVSAGAIQSIADFAMDQIQNFGAGNPTDVKTQKAQGRIVVTEGGYLSVLELTVPCVISQDGVELEATLEYSKEFSAEKTQLSIPIDSLKGYPQVSMWDLPW